MSTSLHGISSLATRAVLTELAEAWHSRGGGVVRFESVGGVDAAQRVQAGELFDLVVLASDALERLCAGGAALTASKVDIARSTVAIAVRAGASRPDVGSEAALRATVLAAASIGYSTGPSGVALLRLFERWGVHGALRGRLVQAPSGTPVGRLIALAQVELGFQQLSELVHVEGVEVVGPMPAGLEIVTTFCAAQCAVSSNAGAVRALLDFLRSGDASDIKRRHHLLAA